jgi:hypothetical protein
MAVTDRVPTDLVADDLVDTYTRGAARLEDLIREALRRGLDPRRAQTPDARAGDATAAYRLRQLAAARTILADLQARGPRLAPVAVARSYTAGLVAVDATLDAIGQARPGVRGTFGGVHQRAVQVLAGNLTRTLTAAVERTGENVETVFARADTLEGALHPTRPMPTSALPFIGRRQDDPYRRAALEVIGEQTVSLETRRQVSEALTRRLIDEGTTDALTGFIDRAGRRWPLPVYTEMVARTTTREATSRAVVGRLQDHGHDLVTVSSHPHHADECSGYDGETFSLSGRDPEYPELDQMPPFHPRAVLGDTPVEPVGALLGAVRAVYDGPAIRVESHSGIRATVSPNHPVLTRRGWLPARLLREGDEVIRAVARHRARAPVAGEDLHDVPARAAEVFDAARAVGASARTIAAPVDLHGDARFCEREVDVVRTDGGLRQHRLAAINEEPGEDPLVRAGVQHSHLPGPGPLGVLFARRTASVARPLPEDYASRAQPTPQGRLGEWTVEREFLAGLPGQVAVDELVEVRYVDRWAGHAFDFETEAGVYFAGGLYTHNCRHVLTPAAVTLDRFEEVLGRAAARPVRR